MTAQSGLGFSGIVAIQIPDEGATGEVLTKLTPDDYDYDWLAGGGGGGAPANAEYVVMSLDATLTDERVLTAGADIDIVDGGAGGAVTISVTALAFGDVFKVGTPVDDQVAVWTGDGTIEGTVNLTFVDGERLDFLVTTAAPGSLTNQGFMIENTNSVINPDGWAIVPGAPGLFDGELIVTDEPANAVTNLNVRFLKNNATVFDIGARVADNSSFGSGTAGALAFYMPLDLTGREEGKISAVGFVGGTGHEGVLSIEIFNFGDLGLQFNRVTHFVVDPDYRIHIDILGALLLSGTEGLAAGETGVNRNLVSGLQLIGQGSTNDVTIYNDTLTPVIEIPTGGTLVEFAGDIRPAGMVQWDKGADIASAATLVLGSDGNSFDVTGTTTITAVSAEPIGTLILLQFDGVLTMEQDATALILQDDVDFVTEPGNTIGLHSYDGTNWREVFRNDGSNVRVSGNIADQAMVRGNGGAKRIQDTGNFIGDDEEIIMAGTVILQNFTDAQLNDIGNSVNTNDGKASGAIVFNSSQGHVVSAQGSGAGDVWNDGVGTTTNTPV